MGTIEATFRSTEFRELILSFRRRKTLHIRMGWSMSDEVGPFATIEGVQLWGSVHCDGRDFGQAILRTERFLSFAAALPKDRVGDVRMAISDTGLTLSHTITETITFGMGKGDINEPA